LEGAFSYQLSAISFGSSGLNYVLALSYQPSAISFGVAGYLIFSYQLSAISPA